jgi:glycerophosphoryl diester phosphodiesterase
MAVVDAAMAATPRRVPDKEALQRCRLIAHRGEHDNLDTRENTLAAFRAARDAGVWGIECDIRWTRDLVPVICHDATPARVFNVATPLADMTFEQLRSKLPEIPSLAEVIDEFGGATHLMLEIKRESRPDEARQKAVLEDLLAPLAPCDDFHILALDTPQFQFVDFLPASCWLPVAELNVPALSRFALERGCAGLGGHYLLLNNRLKARHDALGQQLGVGFPASRNGLFRELNRGVEWVFSNDAVKLQQVLDNHL